MAARMSASARPRVLSARNQNIASRFSFGVSEALVAEIRRKGGSKKWVEWQLAPSRVSDPAAAKILGWFPYLKDSPDKAWSRVKAGKRSGWDYGYDFNCYQMARKIVSRRQVQEVMTDFWTNLLYIPAYEDRSFPWRLHYDSTIRRHSLGTYRSLLRATVLHPAMSGWLNNNSNTKRGINENLGRELLELYTVGRLSGYTEDDVQNSARLLTGFKVRVFEDFKASYNPADHYVGRVQILDFVHHNRAADGRAAVVAYLDYLARHPDTARKLARRLCTRFVSDSPSSAIVTAVARSYLRNDTSIKAMIRTMIAHPDFYRSRLGKVRTPVEDVVNAARVLNMKPTAAKSSESFARQVIWMASSVGQEPLTWPRPDGFPETSTTWASPARVLRSWSMHYSLSGNWWGSKNATIRSKKNSLPTKWPRNFAQLVDHQSRMLLGRPSTPEMRIAAARAANVSLARTFRSRGEVSDWTWLLIRSSVLNSPEGMLR